MRELIVMAHFHCQVENAPKVKALVDQLCADTMRLEPGCVSYEALFEVDNFTVCTTLERWQSAEAEAAHWDMPHLHAALEKLGPLLAGEPKIIKYHACIAGEALPTG